MNGLYLPPEDLERLSTPYEWTDFIQHNKDRADLCAQIGEASNAAFVIYLPETTADRVDDLAKLALHRIASSKTLDTERGPMTGRYHLALTGGGVPYASALGRSIYNMSPSTQFRMGYANMGRYGNSQSGKDQLDIKQAPVASEIDGMDVTLVDDLIDKGTTIKLAAIFLRNKGVPYSSIIDFMVKAYDNEKITEEAIVKLYGFYKELTDQEPDVRVAKTSSVAATVLIDKDYKPEFGDLFTHIDIGGNAPKVWLKLMGMDGLFEDGRWGEGVVASGVQEIQYAQEMSDALEIVGDLARLTMDGKNSIFWLDENGAPAKLPKTFR